MQTSKGFTIVELLVVIAIIAILTAIVVANLPKFKLKLSLTRVAYKFEQDTKNAQLMAMSSSQYKDSGGALHTATGYGIYAVSGSTQYVIYADVNGNQHYDSADYIVQTVNFGATEPGIIIQAIDNVTGTSADINFASPINSVSPNNVPTLINQLTSGKTSINIVFAMQSDSTQTATVAINTTGLIQTGSLSN